jgi:hypothetical protein
MASTRINDTGVEIRTVELPGSTVRNLAAQAVTAGTPVAVHTPASGKKFRLCGYAVSMSVAGSVVFKYGGSNTEFLRTPVLPANTPVEVDTLGAGIAPGAAGDALKVDVTASGSVSGHLLVSEE